MKYSRTKYCCLAFLMFVCSHVVHAQNNYGFENADLGAWTARLNGAVVSPNLGVNYSGFYITGDTDKIHADVNEPAVCPSGGLYSLRLGTFLRNSYTHNLYSIERELYIDSDTFQLPYWYAMYYEIHDAYYSISVYDSSDVYYQNSSTLDFSFQGYSFFVKGNLYNRFIKWKPAVIKLLNLKGKTVTLKFEVKGCSEGGHTALMWIDFECQNLNTHPNVYQCNDDINVLLNNRYSFNVYDYKSKLLTQGDTDRFYVKLNERQNLKLIYRDDKSCATEYTIPVSEDDRFVDYQVQSKYCLYETIFFKNFSVGFNKYEWDFDDGASVVSNNTPGIYHKFNQPGTYNVKLLSKDSFCIDSIIQNLNIVNHKHGVSFKETQVCIGDTLTIVPAHLTKNSSYTWRVDTVLHIEKELVLIPESERIYSIGLFSIDSNSCKDTFYGTISSYLKPDPFFSVLVTGKNEYQFFPVNFNLTYRYQWFYETDSLWAKQLQRIILDTSAYQVRLRVYNDKGCYSDSVLVIYNNEVFLFVPNAFNPKTSEFKPYTNHIISYTLEIYNRWGELLFRTDDPDIGWDGTYKDELVQQDVYVYRIFAKDIHNKLHNESGSLTVLR